MGKALQRLLARPSSLILLRYLVEEPALEETLRKPINRPLICSRHHQHRSHTIAAATAHELQKHTSEDVEPSSARREKPSTLPLSRPLQRHLTVAHQSVPLSSETVLEEVWRPKTWEEYSWTSEELEFQSNLDADVFKTQRLIDDRNFEHDMKLWAYLLDFRKRRYGDDGVVMFWRAVRTRGVDLPTEGYFADTFWVTFVDLGLKNTKILSQICRYADDLYDRSGNYWPGLYVHVMKHMIMGGKRNTMIHWHDRLIQRHPPGPAAFYTFLHDIVVMRGDLKALRDIYKRHEYHQAYANIVPALLDQGDFHSAFDWHFFLMTREDYPVTQKVVEPLIHHYAVYDPPKAVKLTKSLVEANVSFALSIVANLEENKKISREMMNLIHGEAFHVKPKKYNDNLGARWFATKWISLDLAINTIHALGVESIGPLSLQAIIRRESSPSVVVHRLEQLRELGISTGNSIFSKAVEAFARDNEAEHLKGLVESDQHPESLDDWRLQESLLVAYERDQDWRQYHRTVAIRLVASANPKIEQYNVILRKHVTNNDRAAILQSLEEMRINGIAVTQSTVRYILRNILPSRRKGHVSSPTLSHLNDIHTAVSILTSIMKFNGFVSVYSWREIIRRLGMLGKIDDVEQLCLWLAKWYRSDGSFRSHVVGQSLQPLPVQGLHLAPAQIPTSHHLHPLRMLFSDDQQKAIIEWAFKHDMIRSLPKQTTTSSSDAIRRRPDHAHGFTRGVALLHQLRREGVFINMFPMRDALLNRLIILYGPGESNIVRNRLLKKQNTLALDEMIEELDGAWGGKIFPDVEGLKAQVERESYKRIARSQKLDEMRHVCRRQT